MLVPLVACGSGGSESTTGADVHGVVYADVPVDIPCEEQAAGPSRPDELSGIEIVFSVGDGEVGRASTGALEWSPLEHGCRFLAAYLTDLPEASRYQARFEVPTPREWIWVEVGEQEVTREELEGAGYQWDFESTITHVVVDPPCAFDGTDCVTTTTAP